LQRTTATVVMDNVPGPLGTTGKTMTFMSSGGQVILVVSGSAWSGAASILDVAVQLDGVTIGHLKTYTNEGSSHKAFPARAITVSPLAAGTHTIGLVGGAATVNTDATDWFNVTAVELGH
jgi:hypothetical protein